MRAGALDYIVKSEGSLLDMPRIAEGAIRLWSNLVAKELAQERLRVTEEALREQRRTEEQLLENERRLRELADAMPQIMWTSSPSGYVDYFNRRWYEFTGSAEQPGGDQGWTGSLHPDDVQPYRDCWCAAMKSGEAYEFQARLWDRRQGSFRWYLARALPQHDDRGTIVKWVGTATDIDDHKRLSEELEHRVEERTVALQKSLAEATMLLKEVHHRVKNNLQVICSLLSMQLDGTADDLFSRPLKDAHSRVLAMSLIHEQIYQSETLADLDLGGYVEHLSQRLFSTYCLDASRIRLELSVEKVQLRMDQAIPCGLILNELISNSLKHAFPEGREGVIRISLSKSGPGQAELGVSDNGVGFPGNFRWQDGQSLGLQVVRTLIHQLRAKLSVSGDGGASFRFSWALSAAEAGG
jgi:PAS domain S-box-containing protein